MTTESRPSGLAGRAGAPDDDMVVFADGVAAVVVALLFCPDDNAAPVLPLSHGFGGDGEAMPLLWRYCETTGSDGGTDRHAMLLCVCQVCRNGREGRRCDRAMSVRLPSILQTTSDWSIQYAFVRYSDSDAVSARSRVRKSTLRI